MSTIMPTADIYKAVSVGADVSQAVVKRVLKCYHEVIREACVKGLDVQIAGVGKFTSKTMPARDERKAMNLATGEPMILPPRPAFSKPIFKMTKPLLEEVKELTMGQPFDTK